MTTSNISFIAVIIVLLSKTGGGSIQILQEKTFLRQLFNFGNDFETEGKYNAKQQLSGDTRFLQDFFAVMPQ